MQLKDNKNFLFNKDISKGNEDCQNILIHGDNKDVLPELWPVFANRIRCIYIDPPYNNGEIYHYYNDNSSQGNWLIEMRRVLNQLKPLLSKDGSIWISIDDSEMAYLKVEADLVFGRENFAGTIIWQQRKSRENRAVFSCNHEYILVYARNIKEFKKRRNLLPVKEDFIQKNYKNPDNDPRGPWQSVTANVQSGHAVASQFYTVVSPTGVRHNPPKGRCWIYSEERMLHEIAAGNIWFGKDGNNTPRVKKFLRDAKIGLTPETIWLADEVGTSDSAKKQLMTLFPEKEYIFETPKPEELLKRIIEIASDKGDYILDCFLGSGTTIAVSHKLNRRYIGIERGNQMCDLVVNRMNKVINGDNNGISETIGWKGGGNFIFYNFLKNPVQVKTPDIIQPVVPKEQSTLTPKKQTHYHQLNLFELWKQYPDTIVENNIVHENFDGYETNNNHHFIIKPEEKVLVCNVKPNNERLFLNKSAVLYYTGKRFPSTVDLNKLYYFMPYIKHKGIRDLYLIKSACIGTRKEGETDRNPSDLRLIFEIEFIKQYFEDFKHIDLRIWRTFTDTTICELDAIIMNS